MSDAELARNIAEGQIVTDPHETFNRALFEQLQDLENAILNYPETGNTVGGKLELKGNGVEIKSNGTVVDGKTIIGKNKNSDGSDSVQLFAMPEHVDGFGSNLISFRSGLAHEKTIAHPGLPENPSFMLKIYRHMDPATLQEAQHRIANGIGSMDYVFTTYLIADGAIGKLVHLPPYTPDPRAIVESTRGGKIVMGTVEEEDQGLIVDTVKMLQERLRVKPSNMRVIDSDNKLKLE